MKNGSTFLQRFLIAAALVLLLVIVFYLGRATVLGLDDPLDTPSATPTASATSSAEETAAPTPTQAADYAPSVTKPEALELVREQPRRLEGDPRALGKIDAPVVMVTYEDFSCPVCTHYFTKIHPELQPLVDDGTLRIEFRNLVIFPNYGSDLAAYAAYAAGEQGYFWDFAKVAFEAAGEGEHPTYTEESVEELAKQAGVQDLDEFREAFHSDRVRQAVDEETTHAHTQLGISGTPFFIINDAVVPGAQPAEFMINTIMHQRDEAK